MRAVGVMPDWNHTHCLSRYSRSGNRIGNLQAPSRSRPAMAMSISRAPTLTALADRVTATSANVSGLAGYHAISAGIYASLAHRRSRQVDHQPPARRKSSSLSRASGFSEVALIAKFVAPLPDDRTPKARQLIVALPVRYR